MTAVEKVQALLDAANTATGESDTNLTDAVVSLIAGQGITPSGSLPISSNGTYDVTQYASAVVNVQGGTDPGYVTDGLVCRFDAIRNTRAGHDASAEGWEDLSGNGHDLTSKGTNPPIWGDNWCYLSNAWLDGAPISVDTPHVEIVLQIGKAGLQTIAGNGSSVGTKIGSVISKNTSFVGPVNGTFEKSAKLPVRTGVFSECFEANYCDVFYRSNPEASSEFAFTPTGRLYIAARSASESTYLYHGYVMALRFYSRELSDAEIAQNFAADAVRFGAGIRVISLEELFSALPTVTTAHTISVNADQLAAASAETIAIATGKGWTVA